MIVGLTKAILHILDAMSGVTMYSDTELDVSDASISNFVITHIEKLYEDAGMREGEFNSNSGFKYRLQEYIDDEVDFVKLSQAAAERVYEGISTSDKPESCDVVVCEFVVNERRVLGILKCDNKVGYTHQVVKEEGQIKNALINHYAILPSLQHKIRECAFVRMDDLSIRYKGRKRKIDGEELDLIADLLLECVFDLSTKESINAVKKIAKKVTEDNGGDSIETSVKMKQYITDNISDIEFIEPQKLADAVFDGRPVMKDEFVEKVKDASVPEQFEANKYVTQKLSSNVKIVTDIGVEIIFPAEFYKDNEHIEIINNDDGTISIKINNIGELINK